MQDIEQQNRTPAGLGSFIRATTTNQSVQAKDRLVRLLDIYFKAPEAQSVENDAQVIVGLGRMCRRDRTLKRPTPACQSGVWADPVLVFKFDDLIGRVAENLEGNKFTSKNLLNVVIGLSRISYTDLSLYQSLPDAVNFHRDTYDSVEMNSIKQAFQKLKLKI